MESDALSNQTFPDVPGLLRGRPRRRRLESRPGTPPTGRREPVPAHSLPRRGGLQPGRSCAVGAAGPAAHHHGPRGQGREHPRSVGQAPSLLPASLSGRLPQPRPWQLGAAGSCPPGGSDAWNRHSVPKSPQEAEGRRKSVRRAPHTLVLSLSLVPTASVPRARTCAPSFALGT